jgi:U6 snRNA-associated Sm-like protein LSm7
VVALPFHLHFVSLTDFFPFLDFITNRGRELVGTLRGYDDLVNLVVDDCEEFLRDPSDLSRVTNQKRRLGLVVVRGTQVSLVSPDDGFEEIDNPFIAEGEDE